MFPGPIVGRGNGLQTRTHTHKRALIQHSGRLLQRPLSMSPCLVVSLALQLQARMKANMGAAYDRVIFYPRLPNSDTFMSFISVVDVLLHPFPFDGSKTSADGLAMGIPVVTWPSVSTKLQCLNIHTNTSTHVFNAYTRSHLQTHAPNTRVLTRSHTHARKHGHCSCACTQVC